MQRVDKAKVAESMWKWEYIKPDGAEVCTILVDGFRKLIAYFTTKKVGDTIVDYSWVHPNYRK